MKNTEDIRWKQRFSNYEKALKQLKNAIEQLESFNDKEQKNNYEFFDIVKIGIIKSFEFTFELAWNLMKDYAFYQGISDAKGSRDAFKIAVQFELITPSDFHIWSKMIESRNQTSHIYDEDVANEILIKIKSKYYAQFIAFYEVMKNKITQEKLEIGLTDILIEKIQNVFSKYKEIESVIVFGSRAKGNFRNGSDIDIALKGEISFDLRTKIALALDEIEIPYEIDLKVFNTISNQDLVEHINRVGVSIYEKNI
jgi:nucleotidyltransferase substrate binding protein (TIGR01987 family)